LAGKARQCWVFAGNANPIVCLVALRMFTRIANSFRPHLCPTATLLCVMVALFTASKATANPSTPSPHAIDIPRWFSESFLDFREDIADAARQGKRLLVYFGQDGCPYCTQLMKVNFSQPDIVARTRQNFIPVALNLWGDREVTWIDGRRMSEKELGQMLKVQFTPTMLFFDETGKIALRLNGYSPPGKFRLALEYVSRHRDARESFAEYVAAASTAKPGGELISEPFFVRGAMNLPRMLAASDKPVLLVFEQRNCRECEELHREAFQRREVR
jgi:thioredoxin-related protein